MPESCSTEHAGSLSSRRLEASLPNPAPVSDAKLPSSDLAATARTVNAWRGQWKQLAIQAWSGESDAARETQNLRALTHLQVEELRSAQHTATSERKVEEEQVWNSLTLLRKRVRALGQNIEFAPKKDDVWRMVQAVERELQIFAEQERQQFEEHVSLECSLENGLQASLARFEGWCELPSAALRPRPAATRLARSSSCSRLSESAVPKRGAVQLMHNEPEEVSSIRGQVEKLTATIEREGGTTGGWKQEDHEEFLRVFRTLRRNGPGNTDIIAEIQSTLPHIAHERLVAHVNWLETYNERQNAKRLLLERWRELREQRSSALVSASLPSGDGEKELNAAEAKQARLQCARRREEAQRSRAELKQQVAEWKTTRSEQSRCQEEEQRRRAEHESKKRDQERLASAEQAHLALEAFRHQKAAEASAFRRGKDGASITGTRAISCEDRKRIAARSAAACQRQALRRQCSTPPSRSRFDPPTRTPTAYAHVESRLHQETVASVSRERSCREDSQSLMASESLSKYGVCPGSFAHQGIVRTTRALPAWRGQFGA